MRKLKQTNKIGLGAVRGISQEGSTSVAPRAWSVQKDLLAEELRREPTSHSFGRTTLGPVVV